jgi:hypothetical protein
MYLREKRRGRISIFPMQVRDAKENGKIKNNKIILKNDI